MAKEESARPLRPMVFEGPFATTSFCFLFLSGFFFSPSCRALREKMRKRRTAMEVILFCNSCVSLFFWSNVLVVSNVVVLEGEEVELSGLHLLASCQVFSST